MAEYRLGIDVGSTTVKAVLLRGEEIIFQDYRRHHADVRAELAKLLDDISFENPGIHVAAAITGSGGLSVATMLGVPFVQEVIAGTEATRKFYPQADVIIELGGEDAKLTYLHPTPEQRMNGTCAGGTGAFIDQMATLLKTDAAGLDELASRYQQLYPIASRCGVFAKTDLQPLLNQGAAHEDLAASIFQSVATQTVAGLANGRPIRGTVLFLGGPLHFMPQLREAYKRILSGVSDYITPDNGQLYVAMGAAILAGKPQHGAAAGNVNAASGEPGHAPQLRPLATMGSTLRAANAAGEGARRMRPLFANADEHQEFQKRHARASVAQRPTSAAQGDCFLGIDAGSTTIKAVLIDSRDQIVFTHYASNQGDPVRAAVSIVQHIQRELPAAARIVRSCSTGYGEGIVKTALGVDEGVVETMAHFRAAEYLQPGVTSVIDIGGQDMKYLKIKNGAVDSISVNEACSSGCGSFLQTFAETMGTDVRSFAAEATRAQAPVDLGTRCTVFMNSSVKQAQKEGAGVGDISAGLSYSVVRNALYKVIKLKDASDLGERVVVQGGTFLNDAVLRAFELLTEREVVRPNIAGLMGAFGAALTAKMHFDRAAAEADAQAAQRRDPATGELRLSSLLTVAELEGLTVETELKTCRFCQNHCTMTISQFSTGERHVSGNRCERGLSLEKAPKKSPIPNMFDWKYKRLFGYRRLTESAATRGDIGIPRVLNMYEDYPFWFTVLTALKYRVMISGRSNHELFESGMESIPSENVCYPAKLVHGHIEALLDKGIKRIFYPCVTYNSETAPGQDNTFNCPIVGTYPEVIRTNMERIIAGEAEFISPFFSFANREKLPERLAEVFARDGVSVSEAQEACRLGWEEWDAYHADVLEKGRESLAYIREHQIRGVVLAGRPYHLDPEINHGIPEAIVGLGVAVLTEDAVNLGHLERPLRVRDQWAFHSRLYEAAATVGDDPDLSLVQLISFGCGLDAITADQVQEILEGRADVYTSLKIDEVSNLGAAKIRLRSLTAAVEERAAGAAESADVDTTRGPAAQVMGESFSENPCAQRSEEPSVQAVQPARHVLQRTPFTEQMREAGYTILVPQMAPIHFRLLMPIFQRAGFNMRLLEHTSKDDIEVGLKYVNNDACYPALVVIGQLIAQFTTGAADPNHTAVGITQTGGMCRATNYAALLRKGLKDAGFPQVPVIAISAQGLEENPGFKISAGILHRGLQAITIGDVLQRVLLRTRPYQIDGNVQRLYERWDQIVREWFGGSGEFAAPRAAASGEQARRQGYSITLGTGVHPDGTSAGVDGRERKIGFHALVKQLVREFDEIPLLDIPRKPRVGMVGEILVQYHPDANNNAVGTVEREGCEAELPSLMQFFHQSIVTADWKYRTLGYGTKKSVRTAKLALWALQQYEKPMRAALQASQRFEAGATIQELAAKVQKIAQLGNQAGEGWYLTADMMDMIERGCPNIICAQPFACLPNHVIGKGMFHALRSAYPQANIVGIDYDPGASEVNQLNRIKLMISTAFLQHEQQGSAGDGRLPLDPRIGLHAEEDLDAESDTYLTEREFGKVACGGATCGCGAATSFSGERTLVQLKMPTVRA
ncbi:MAG: acyl-CoA dehydratase activase-related protein [Arcanobacterium sp.]|nr:acyl-CoA dehydratase activase-related protein [Arcanobacterium sp.]